MYTRAGAVDAGARGARRHDGAVLEPLLSDLDAANWPMSAPAIRAARRSTCSISGAPISTGSTLAKSMGVSGCTGHRHGWVQSAASPRGWRRRDRISSRLCSSGLRWRQEASRRGLAERGAIRAQIMVSPRLRLGHGVFGPLSSIDGGSKRGRWLFAARGQRRLNRDWVRAQRPFVARDGLRPRRVLACSGPRRLFYARATNPRQPERNLRINSLSNVFPSRADQSLRTIPYASLSADDST